MANRAGGGGNRGGLGDILLLASVIFTLHLVFPGPAFFNFCFSKIVFLSNCDPLTGFWHWPSLVKSLQAYFGGHLMF